MKQMSVAFSIVLVCGVILAACAPQGQPAQPPAPAPTQAPAATAPAPAPTTAPAAAPTSAPAGIQHTMVPGDLPSGKGLFLGDQSSVSSLNKGRALVGDRFTLGHFERPYNANTQDVYYPFVDLVSGNFYPDPVWVYVRITLVGRDANNTFPAKYAVEVDANMDGRGEFLVMATNPSSNTWTTDGVQVFKDANHDVGGENLVNSDSQGKGDGYETVIFDAGKGNDPDAAWVRLSATDPNSIEMAFKTSLLEGDSTYLAGLWAGTDLLNPSLFDINDHFTHEQAGEANDAIANFYPIKAVYELDNTCRAAIGFVPSGKEPLVCSEGTP
jgi:hypothetical protein